jgi:hypothetical protein
MHGKCGLTRKSEAVRSKAGKFGITGLRFVASLPLDRRHNAKVDYPALRAMMEAPAGG